MSYFNKKNIIPIGLSLFFIIIILYILLFVGKTNENPGGIVVKEENTVIKSSCSINSGFLYSLSFLDFWEEKITIKRKEDIKDKIILNCSNDLEEKNKNFISVVKSYIPSYVNIVEEGNKITFDSVNKKYLKNILKEKYINGEKRKVFFKYKEKSPFIIKVEKLLKGYKNISNLTYSIDNISNFEKIKYGKFFKKYGNDIIITNYKFYLDINPSEKDLLSKLSNNNDFQNMVDLEKIFNNSFIEDDVFIILKNVDDFFKENK